MSTSKTILNIVNFCHTLRYHLLFTLWNISMHEKTFVSINLCVLTEVVPHPETQASAPVAGLEPEPRSDTRFMPDDPKENADAARNAAISKSRVREL